MPVMGQTVLKAYSRAPQGHTGPSISCVHGARVPGMVQSDGECAGRHYSVSLTFRVWSLMVSLRKHGRGMK